MFFLYRLLSFPFRVILYILELVISLVYFMLSLGIAFFLFFVFLHIFFYYIAPLLLYHVWFFYIPCLLSWWCLELYCCLPYLFISLIIVSFCLVPFFYPFVSFLFIWILSWVNLGQSITEIKQKKPCMGKETIQGKKGE
jgi:hypothetical protein